MAERRLASGRSGRWAFMDRFEVPQYDGDGTYLTRWRVIQTPLGGLYVHRFTGPDPRLTLHDHPWSFLSIVLRGGYVERRLDPETMQVNEVHTVRRWNRIRASEAHSIVRLLRVPTWTLMLVGRRVRTWGYLEPVGNMAGSRVPFEDEPHHIEWRWTEFSDHFHNTEFVEALARRKASANGGRTPREPLPSDPCTCGHNRSEHIYYEGACRPGFFCECGSFEASTNGEPT